MEKHHIAEYAKCRNDPVHFIRNYSYIRHPTKGLIKFKLWDFQEKVVNDFVNHSYNIILKARQLGLSTLCASYITWLITFYKDKEVFVIATKADTATNLVSKVKIVMQNLPEWMAPKLLVDNRQSLELANGSRVKATGTTENAARSESLSLLIVDECSFVRNFAQIWISAQPTLATGGDCIILSTPNGVGNWFHKTYTEAIEGKKIEVAGKMTSFNPIQLHWSLHPERDDKWASNERAKIGERAFAQEHECDFLQSGSNVFDMNDLGWYKKYPDIASGYPEAERPHIRNPIEKTWIGKDLWIWKYPDPTGEYILAADVARGDGGDYSAFHVIDVENYEQVAEYKGQISTDIYAQLILATAVQYNNAFVAIENNSIGHHVSMKMLENEYRNIYWTVKDVSKVNTDNIDSFSIDIYNVPKNAIPGFATSGKTRPLIISRIEEDIRNKDFVFHSERLFNELTTFVFENGKPQAMQSYNDDLIMSAAIGCYVRYSRLCLFGNQQAKQMMVKNMSRADEQYPLSFSSSRNRAIEDSFIIKVGVEKEDMRWLLG